MNYYWTRCAACACEVAIQFSKRPGGLRGSVRRWSSDRSVNDGRLLDVAAAAVSPAGGFETFCVCGGSLAVDGARVEHATTERPD